MALTATPLLAGNDILAMTSATRKILLNRQIIAVDQDSLGIQASAIRIGAIDMWVNPSPMVPCGRMVNIGVTEMTANVKVSDLGLVGEVKSARDLWKHIDVAFHDGVYVAKVPSHGVVMLRRPMEGKSEPHTT